MCGRYGGPKDLEVYAGYLPVEPLFEPIELRPEYTIGSRAPVFAKNRTGQVVVQSMRMGFIPHWYHGAIKDWEPSTHNARLETLGQKESFARSWNRGWRCVVPAAWISESLGVVDAPGGRLAADFLRQDGQPMGLAGLWDYAVTADGPLLSFALITREPGAKMKSVHPREVCVIESELWAAYLEHGDIGLGRPWADDAWLMRFPEKSRKKIAESSGDLFSPRAA